MNTVALLRDAFREARRTLESTVADVTPEQAHWCPPGTAQPIAAQYAHTVIGEDVIISVFIRHSHPLVTTTWAGKTGLSELPPSTPAWEGWARRVKMDVPSFREYAAAVYASTDAHLASLTPESVGAEVDFFGQKRTLGNVLGALQGGHRGPPLRLVAASRRTRDGERRWKLWTPSPPGAAYASSGATPYRMKC